MNDYLQFKNELHQRLEILEETIEELEQNGLIEKSKAFRWRNHLDQVHSSLQESLLRIGVVGSVKSGKSTLINTFVGMDLLKRGAGIITAFITRIRTDEKIEGWVELKPWSLVLEELNTALRMLPIFQEEMGSNGFLDVRRPEDRERLAQYLERIQTEWQQTRGQIDPNFILLNAYLKGYNRLHSSMDESEKRLIFDEHSLTEHQNYVGEESRAVYIRDMELHYPIPWLGKELEIGDCQGSDSPNPTHFTLLQQYLLQSHFILYTINSRTGLREADFKLLDFIKTLRMFPQTLFILNIDLDSHPHREDLDRSVERVRTELGWIVPNPQIFAFSALYHLIAQQGEKALKRDRRRLELWRDDESLSCRTQEGFASFREHLTQKISSQRTRLLLGSGLGRLSMVAGAITDRAQAQKKFMDQNLGNLKSSVRELKEKQKVLRSTLGTLENAVKGLKDSLKRELEEAVRRYFDLKYSPIITDTLDTVEHYFIDPQYLQGLTDSRQVLRQLHRFYLDFRQALSRYLVEKVNLRIIEFAKEQEEFLQERLEHSSRAFWSLFTTALDDYRHELEKFHIELRSLEAPRSSEWISQAKIPVPPFSAFVDQDALGQGALLMKFGLGRLSRLLTNLKSRLGKWGEASNKSKGNENLQEAIDLVKSETQAELVFAFRDYRNNFKYTYLFKLLEKGTQRLEEEFKARAEMTQLDLENFLKHSEVEGEKRQSVIELLTRVSQITQAMAEELDRFKDTVSPKCQHQEAEANPEEQEPSEQAQTS
jgi:hypothetical protein